MTDFSAKKKQPEYLLKGTPYTMKKLFTFSLLCLLPALSGCAQGSGEPVPQQDAEISETVTKTDNEKASQSSILNIQKKILRRENMMFTKLSTRCLTP